MEVTETMLIMETIIEIIGIMEMAMVGIMDMVVTMDMVRRICRRLQQVWMTAFVDEDVAVTMYKC